MQAVLKQSIAEFLGTAMLVCVIVGSGILASRLSSDGGVELLINITSIVLALILIIVVLAPISGAQLNPVVSMVALFNRSQGLGQTLAFTFAQIVGAITGALFANGMFDLPAIQFSNHTRVTNGTLLGEIVATAGLIIIIGILAQREHQRFTPFAVAAWIYSACFFTSSTSFANPAVTIGRAFTGTYSGIELGSVLPFIAAQIVGGLIGLLVVRGLAKS